MGRGDKLEQLALLAMQSIINSSDDVATLLWAILSEIGHGRSQDRKRGYFFFPANDSVPYFEVWFFVSPNLC